MAKRTIDFNEMVGRHNLAAHLAALYDEWNSYRSRWVEEKKELRNYIFATDTSKTANAALPWKNSTTIPKLCQIRDNLHANYMAALFPNDNWVDWEGDDENAEEKEKRLTIEHYIKNKTRQSDFEIEVEKLIYDYIDYGNCFSTVEYVNETTKDPNTDEEIPGYVGPKLVRISPLDIVFNPAAASFDQTPKIRRYLKTMGDIAADIEDHPELGYQEDVFTMMNENREKILALTEGDVAKNQAYQIDGFGSLLDYYKSGYVEILEAYGDFYDVDSGELLKNHIITIVDRSHVLRKVPNPSWLGKSPIKHSGWRLRPDNLYAMGPLDNLVGMQYRIDHLENLKADVFDQIAFPILRIKGHVEDFDFAPGARIYLGDDGDVAPLVPDTTALNADTQIAILENKMEEMAGAPKQAMGIRTPGEKTKFEVQSLENAAGRIFQSKVNHFEKTHIEPQLNNMLETSRRNMDTSDVVRVMDDETGAILFENVTKEDITAKGKLRPVGSRHFAQKANMLQNLVQMTNSAMAQDPAVNVHISGFKLAQAMEELLEVERMGLVEENIRVAEQTETARMQQSAQGQLQGEAGPVPPEGEALEQPI